MKSKYIVSVISCALITSMLLAACNNAGKPSETDYDDNDPTESMTLDTSYEDDEPPVTETDEEEETTEEERSGRIAGITKQSSDVEDDETREEPDITTTEPSAEATTTTTTEATTTTTTVDLEPYAGLYDLGAAKFNEAFVGKDNTWKAKYTFGMDGYPNAPISMISFIGDGTGMLAIKNGNQSYDVDLTWGMTGSDITMTVADGSIKGVLKGKVWVLTLTDIGTLYYALEGEPLTGVKTTTYDKALISEANSCYYGTASSGCDLKKAEKFYKELADMKNPYGWYGLGRLYANNKYLDTEHSKKAIEYYDKAIKAKYALGYIGKGYLYLYGSGYTSGVKKDRAKAKELFEKGLDAGRLEGAVALGDLYKRGDPDNDNKPDGDKALEYFNKALASDSDYIKGWAYNDMAIMYLNGAGNVAVDKDKAFELLKKSESLGFCEAYANLGYCYQYASGVAKDIKKAISYYEEGAKRGSGYAYSRLGYLYRNGTEVDQDYDKALKYFKKAAEFGSVDGLEQIAIFSYYEYGVKKDYKNSLKYFRMAAKENSGFACGKLGYMYYAGEGCKKDKKETFNFAKKGDALGDSYSKYLLGFCYAYGYGTKKDYKKSLEYFAEFIKLSDEDNLIKDSKKVLSDLVKAGHLKQKEVDKALK